MSLPIAQRNVLIISPRFPPTSAPDHQRVRMMLPTLEENGWRAVVLAVDPAFVEAPVEKDLLHTIPRGLEVLRSRALPQSLTRRFRFGSLGLRAYRHIKAAGDELLSRNRFDLVFFSTTEFAVMPLGVRWKRRFGVPFVLDMQDPWVTDYYRETGSPPPGGKFKHGLMQLIARRQEKKTFADVNHVIAVSPAYVGDLRTRYPHLADGQFSVIPFGGARSDFDVMERHQLRQRLFEPCDEYLHWIYAGTAPPGIRMALLGFFMALKKAVSERIIDETRIRLHFVGTDYAPQETARPRILPLAREAGVEHLVHEHPSRIPFLETLRCLVDANALMIFGWNDPGYTASKLYPYILAGKPLLTVLHAESSTNEVMRATDAGTCIPFANDESVDSIAHRIFTSWFVSGAFEARPGTKWKEFERYTAETMTEKVTAVFDRTLEGASRNTAA